MGMAYVEQPLYNSLSALLIFILDCPLVSTISIEFEKIPFRTRLQFWFAFVGILRTLRYFICTVQL